MGSFSALVRALNDLKDQKVVEDYAVAGAMALVFWTEAVPTFDLDVLVALRATGKPLTDLGPIYHWARESGYRLEAGHILIEDVPVQFLPVYNDLAQEAVRTAATLDYKGVPIRVARPEYLIALALDPPAKTRKRSERAATLAESAPIDESLLKDVMERYNLSW